MATKPSTAQASLKAAPQQIFNTIRSNASVNYQTLVPKATAMPDNLKEIGAIIMDYPNLQTEFIHMVGLIAKVIVTSKTYKNPWAFFKKGIMEFGETIEEVFVDLANAHHFDSLKGETELFKTEDPNIKSAFHTLNYQAFYKQTIRDFQLRAVFNAWSGVSDLIAKIVDGMYSSNNYDELNVMKYMICRKLLDGQIRAVPTGPVSDMTAIASVLKGESNNLTFLNRKNNIAGVATYTDKNDQYLIMTGEFDAKFDVEVLAGAFNMSQADFLGHRVLIDSFADIDVVRLNEIIGHTPGYEEISQDDLDYIRKNVLAVLVDVNWFMIYDNLLQFKEVENGQSLYWNFMLHAWKICSISPFANALVFTTATPAVNGVTLTPTSATVAAGSTFQLTANVETVGFASEVVNFTSDSEYATVDNFGTVTINSSAPSATSIVITATSAFDSTKTAEATLTVS